MRRIAKRVLPTAAALLLVGIILAGYAATLPVYTDSEAPRRICQELLDAMESSEPGQKLSSEEASSQWHIRLHAFETPHKRLADLGVGLIGCGAGLLAAWSLLCRYQRHPEERRPRFLLNAWYLCWAIRFPATPVYYLARLQREDYPAWADSIAIPVFSEWVTWLFGCLLTSLVLRQFLRERSLPASPRFVKPATARAWCRTGLIGLWIALLVFLAIINIPCGDAGAELACIPAALVLLIVLMAPRVAVPETAPSPAAG